MAQGTSFTEYASHFSHRHGLNIHWYSVEYPSLALAKEARLRNAGCIAIPLRYKLRETRYDGW